MPLLNFFTEIAILCYVSISFTIGIQIGCLFSGAKPPFDLYFFTNNNITDLITELENISARIEVSSVLLLIFIAGLLILLIGLILFGMLRRIKTGIRISIPCIIIGLILGLFANMIEMAFLIIGLIFLLILGLAIFGSLNTIIIWIFKG